jgi:hypothetical protein
MIRPFPELKLNVPKTIGRAKMMGNDVDVLISMEEYKSRNDFVWNAQNIAREKCGIKILNPLPFLCDKNICSGTKNGLPIYQDDNHISERGGVFLVPMFKEIFKK